MSEVHLVICPYCGEATEIVVDPEEDGPYVEDCEVCCNPWTVHVSGTGSRRAVTLTRADGSE